MPVIEAALGDFFLGIFGTALREVVGAPLANTLLGIFGTALGAIGDVPVIVL